jgi:hypothetical protein
MWSRLKEDMCDKWLPRGYQPMFEAPKAAQNPIPSRPIIYPRATIGESRKGKEKAFAETPHRCMNCLGWNHFESECTTPKGYLLDVAGSPKDAQQLAESLQYLAEPYVELAEPFRHLAEAHQPLPSSIKHPPSQPRPA